MAKMLKMSMILLVATAVTMPWINAFATGTVPNPPYTKECPPPGETDVNAYCAEHPGDKCCEKQSGNSCGLCGQCTEVDSYTWAYAACLDVRIACGTAPMGEMGAGVLSVFAWQPAPEIFSPQGLVYNHPLFTQLASVKTTGLASGISCEVARMNSRNEQIVYQFKTGESIGRPSGGSSSYQDWMEMRDISGTPVTSNPAVFAWVQGTGKPTICYNAAAPYDPVSSRSATGREITPDDIGIKVIRDSNNVIRQVKSLYSLADIVVPPGYAGMKYEVRFYNPDQVGDKNADGTYAVSGNAFSSVTIENPNASTDPQNLNQVRVTRTANGTADVSDFGYTDAQKQWTLLKGGGLSKTTLSKVTNASTGMTSKIRTLSDANDKVVSKEEETRKTFAFGERTLEKIQGMNGVEKRTKYAYWENSGETNHYGRVKSIVNSDGSWTMYDNDAQKRRSIEVRPFCDLAWETVQNMTAAQAAALGRATCYDYTPLDSADIVNADDTRPRTTTEKVQGVIAGITYNVYKSVNGECIKVVERAASQSAAYGAAGNQRTTTVYYATTAGRASAGKVKSVTQPDGKVTTYTYEIGDFLRGDDFGAAVFTPGNGNYLRTTVQTSPLVACKSTRSVIITGMGGKTVHEETQVLTAADSWERISWTGYQLNPRGQVTLKIASNGSRTDTTWGCCNKESEIEPDGTQYFYYYDALNRLTQKVKKGTGDQPDLTTAYEYDAVGRTIKTTVSGGSLSLVTTTMYDALGRTVQTVDSTGLTTGYAYSTDGRTTAVTQPSGGTIISTSYIDGNSKSTSGTAASVQAEEYGVNSDGTTWNKSYAGTIGAPMWQKNTTDFLGRVVLTEKPAYGGTIVLVVNTYNANGQRIKSETLGGGTSQSPLLAPTLYEYDALDNVIRTGLDVDNNGALDLGGDIVRTQDDRVVDQDSIYEKQGDVWWHKSISKVYATANNSVATVVSASYRQLTGLGATTGDGFALNGLTKSVDIRGNESVSQKLVDRANKTVKTVTSSPFSSLPSVAIAINGLQTSQTTATGLTYTFTYDSLGRQVGSLDPRTGLSVTHYNDKDQVDYVQDAAQNKTKFTYDPQTGRQAVVENALGKKKYMAYDVKGQLVRTWGDTEYPTENVYDDQGRLIQLKTFRGGTGWDQSTWPTDTGAADVTNWIYDAATGLLLQKKYADNNGPTYTYDALGRLVTRTWARTLGEGTSQSPLVTTYSYDVATGKLTGKTYSDSTPAVSFTYDRLGRQVTVTDAAGTRTFAYSATDLQLDSETLSDFFGGRMLTRQRDTLGRPVGYRLLNGPAIETQAGYTYDAYGRIASVTDAPASAGTSSIATYGYFPNSDLLATITFANGVVATRSYEPNRDLIASIENKKTDGTVISAFGYTNDAIGRRTAMSKSGTAFATSDTINYSYNSRSEVTSAAAVTDTAYNYQYAFDPIGNRLSANEAGIVNAYTSNTLNQYSSITTSENSVPSVANPSYDLDGNQLTLKNEKGDWTFTWNAENQLVTAQSGSQRLEYTYDYLGRRIEKRNFTGSSGSWVITENVKFIYANYNIIEEYKTVNLTCTAKTFYAWNDANNKSLFPIYISTTQENSTCNQIFFYTLDANRNVSEIINLEGVIVGHYEYTNFGALQFLSGIMPDINPYRFSAEYFDAEIGLSCYSFRYYNPTDGRWINRDPLCENGGVNLYGFCGNSPLNCFDLLGLLSVDEMLKIINYMYEVRAKFSGADYDKELNDYASAMIDSVYKKIDKDAFQRAVTEVKERVDSINDPLNNAQERLDKLSIIFSRQGAEFAEKVGGEIAKYSKILGHVSTVLNAQQVIARKDGFEIALIAAKTAANIGANGTAAAGPLARALAFYADAYVSAANAIQQIQIINILAGIQNSAPEGNIILDAPDLKCMVRTWADPWDCYHKVSPQR